MKKTTRPEEHSRPSKADTRTKPQTKITRILAHLMTGASLNRFEAEQIGEHCLNSTIAVLANRHGLHIHRLRERVPNRFGTVTTVSRYSLPVDQFRRAMDVLTELMRTGSELST